jgi:hypothetical protein
MKGKDTFELLVVQKISRFSQKFLFVAYDVWEQDESKD